MGATKHKFTNPKADGPDATITRPSDWNAMHDTAATGLLSGGAVVRNADPTKFNLAAGTGAVVDYTDPDNPVYTPVSWGAQTAVVVTNLATAPRTYLSINAAGALVQSIVPLTVAELRSSIRLPTLYHGTFTSIVSIRDSSLLAYDAEGRLNELGSAIGVINVSGNEYSANGATLQIYKSPGNSHSMGVNAHVDANAPDTSTDPELAGSSFRYSYRDGAGAFKVTGALTNVNPDIYDDGTGTLAAVPAGQWTVQVMFYIPGMAYDALSGQRLEPGQKVYATSADALADTPNPDHISKPDFFVDGSIRTYLIIQQGCTDLSDVGTALFKQMGKFGGASGGGGGGGTPGADGPMGPAGPPGIDGMDGEPGDAGPPGPAGPEGAQGIQGLAGPAGMGMPGLDGEDGLDGWPGTRGSDGAPGTQGVPGPAGVGLPGLDGEDGLDGWPGVRGSDGAPGAPGVPGPAAGTELFSAKSVAANDVYDYYCALKMTSTDFLVGGASAGTSLSITIEGETNAV